MKVRNLIIVLLSIMVVLKITPLMLTLSEENIDIGELGRFVLGEDDITVENLYIDSLSFTWECNDWDLLYALQKWVPNSKVSLLDYNDNTNANENSEKYSFYVEVEDIFIRNEYIVSFDFWANKLYEEGEYYNCDIQLISSDIKLKEAKWTSRNTDHCYFQLDVRPDGQIGLIGHFYWSTSYDPWETKYSTINLVPKADDWCDQPYGYKVSFNDAIQVMLYPDGTLYNHFYKLLFYPDGMEQQVKGVELTSGNTIGTTSSNLFNGGLYAIEEDFLVYHVGHNVYRSKIDGSNEMCLYSGSESDHIRSLNLINGECYFTCSGEAAYGYDLNGNLIFYVTGDLEQIIADDTTVYYSVFRDTSKSESGLFAYDKATGKITKLINGSVNEIAIDGEWVYFDNRNSNTLYCCKKNGTDFIQLYDELLGPFIAENGVVLFYDRNSYKLHALTMTHSGTIQNNNDVADYTTFGGESAYVGSDTTKKIAFHDGYIYYYYPKDNSMICRMTLDGTVKDQFVCYTDWAKGGIYFFSNSLYLAGENDIYFKMSFLDDETMSPIGNMASNDEEKSRIVVEEANIPIDKPTDEAPAEEAYFEELADEAPAEEAYFEELADEVPAEEAHFEEPAVEAIDEAEETIKPDNDLATFDDGTWYYSDNLRTYTARIPDDPHGLTMAIVWEKAELSDALDDFLVSDIWEKNNICMTGYCWNLGEDESYLDDIFSSELYEGDPSYQDIDIVFVVGKEPRTMEQTIKACRKLNMGLYIVSTNDPTWAIELIRNQTIGL